MTVLSILAGRLTVMDGSGRCDCRNVLLSASYSPSGDGLSLKAGSWGGSSSENDGKGFVVESVTPPLFKDGIAVSHMRLYDVSISDLDHEKAGVLYADSLTLRLLDRLE